MGEHEGINLERLLGDRNRAAFARQHGLRGGGSLISQHVSGHRPISLEAAVIYARALGASLQEVSPSNAKVVRAAAELLNSTPAVTDPLRPSRPPDLAAALPVVLDALAAAPDRQRLRTALLALVDDDAPQYRERLAELLSAGPPDKRTGTDG